MQLEIKHIAPYFPYNLKWKLANGFIGNILYLTKESISFYYGASTTDVYSLSKLRHKPLLRPLSSLTKEITHNGEKFVPIERLDKNIAWFDYMQHLQRLHQYRVYSHVPWDIMEKLLEWHIDVFNLIDQNLAINLETIDKK